jgi:hypothetical protein
MKKLVKTALVGSLSCLMAPPVLAELNTGLVAHFPFSGSMEDVSGNGYRGSPNGGVALTTDREGNEENAYHITHGGFILTNVDDSLISDEMSYSVWFQGLYSRDHSGYSSYPAILISNGGHWLQVSGNTLSRFDSLNQVKTVDAQNFTASLIDSAKQWHHIVVNYSGNKIELFLNGMFFIDFETEEEFSYNGERFMFGKLNPQAGANYVGKLDDIRIYNRVLSEAEVGQLYDYVSKECEACDTAREQGRKAGIQSCKANPATCDISVTGSTEANCNVPPMPPTIPAIETSQCEVPDIAAVIGEDLSLHVSKAQYNTLTDTQILWIDLTFGGANEAGDLMWTLSDYGEVK